MKIKHVTSKFSVAYKYALDYEPIKYLHLPAQVFLICTVALALSQCFEGNVMLSLPLIKYIIFIDDRCDTYIHT